VLQRNTHSIVSKRIHTPIRTDKHLTLDSSQNNEADEEPLTSSLGYSRDLGLSTDIGDEESTEDDGFIPVKSKGRKRKCLITVLQPEINLSWTGVQRSVSTQSTGGGGGGSMRAPEVMNKKQRQNKARRDAEKAARNEGEQERLERYSQHKKELERTRIDEMYQKGKQLSGGMSMSVGNSGKAEWN